MNCRKVNHLLSAYMDGELPGIEHRQIHEHLAYCLECAEEYEGLLRMKRLLAALRVREPKENLSAQILRQVHQTEAAAAAAHPSHWLQYALDWWKSTLPPPKHIAIGASLAAVIGAFVMAQAMDSHNAILWHPASPAEMATYEPAPLLGDTAQRDTFSAFPPVRNVNYRWSGPAQPSLMPGANINFAMPPAYLRQYRLESPFALLRR